MYTYTINISRNIVERTGLGSFYFRIEGIETQSRAGEIAGELATLYPDHKITITKWERARGRVVSDSRGTIIKED